MLIFRRKPNRFEIGFASFLLSISTIGADIGSLNRSKSDPATEIYKKKHFNQLKMNQIQARALLLSAGNQEGADLCSTLKNLEKSTESIEKILEIYASSVLARKYELSSQLSHASHSLHDLNNQLSDLCENKNDAGDREQFRIDYLALRKCFSQSLQEAEHLTFIFSEYLF